MRNVDMRYNRKSRVPRVPKDRPCLQCGGWTTCEGGLLITSEADWARLRLPRRGWVAFPLCSACAYYVDATAEAVFRHAERGGWLKVVDDGGEHLCRAEGP
jgi:hypothetical protein